MNLLDELIKKNRELLLKSDSNEREEHQLIDKLLTYDDCFFRIPMEHALSIIYKIGYDQLTAIDIYTQLISSNTYNEVKNYTKKKMKNTDL